MGRNATAERLRDEGDRICWETIDSHVPKFRPPGHISSRPANYVQLEAATIAYVPGRGETDPLPWSWPAFEHAWSNFLHEFFYWRLADFFVERPPANFGIRYQVLLAGAAEYLCRRYDLDMPEWIDDPTYLMPELSDWYGDWPELRATRFRRCQRAAPEFLRRNLIYEARNLITL